MTFNTSLYLAKLLNKLKLTELKPEEFGTELCYRWRRHINAVGFRSWREGSHRV